MLDPVIAEEGVERLAGAHCYEFYAGVRPRAEERRGAGTFYLTDFLARNFERLVSAPRPRSPTRAAHATSATTPAGLPRPDRGPCSDGRPPRRDAWASSSRTPDRFGELATTIAAVAVGQPAPADIKCSGGPDMHGDDDHDLVAGHPRPGDRPRRRKQSKIVLHPRFQVAIDKAASRAGKRAYDAYIEEWRRSKSRAARTSRPKSPPKSSGSRPSTTSTGSRSSSRRRRRGRPGLAPAHDETQGRARR